MKVLLILIFFYSNMVFINELIPLNYIKAKEQLNKECQESKDKLKIVEFKCLLTSREFLNNKYRIYLAQGERFNSCESNRSNSSLKLIDQLSKEDLSNDFCLVKALREEPNLANEIKAQVSREKLYYFVLIFFIALLVNILLKFFVNMISEKHLIRK